MCYCMGLGKHRHIDCLHLPKKVVCFMELIDLRSGYFLLLSVKKRLMNVFFFEPLKYKFLFW